MRTFTIYHEEHKANFTASAFVPATSDTKVSSVEQP